MADAAFWGNQDNARTVVRMGDHDVELVTQAAAPRRLAVQLQPQDRAVAFGFTEFDHTSFLRQSDQRPIGREFSARIRASSSC